MDFDLGSLTKKMIKEPGAQADALNKMASGLNFKLPGDYLEFMEISNGGEGFIGENSYLSLWKIENLVDWNNKYDVHTYAPGYFIFASDGGGTAYAFSKTNSFIYHIEKISIDHSLIYDQGRSFESAYMNIVKQIIF